jgi:acid phosphatase (class A)
MKTPIIATVLLAIGFASGAQQHRLVEVSSHYRTFQQASASPNPDRAWMDTISFPPAEYGTSIVYLLVKPHYLSEDGLTTIGQSVKFPANSSDQVKKELDYLLELQNKRTTDELKRVEFLANIGYWPSVNLIPSHKAYEQNLKDLFFEGREVIAENINATNFPKVSRLLAGVMQDMRVMEFTVKYTQFRPRPYHLDGRLKPVKTVNSPSFVSGHTLWGFLQAFVWSEIAPEKHDAFIALAEEIRRSREVMGIHFPSDNEAARQIAYRMLQFYLKDGRFQNDLKEAITEWQLKSPKYLK